MNYKSCAEMLFIRTLAENIWKCEAAIINSDAGFVKFGTLNLVEVVLRKLKTSVICLSTGLSQ